MLIKFASEALVLFKQLQMEFTANKKSLPFLFERVF